MTAMPASSDDRRLFTAWVILVALTALSVGVALAGGEGGGSEGAGKWAGAVAMAVAFVKARQVLDHFLDLRRAGNGWRMGFTFALLGLLSGLVLIGLA